MQLVVQAAGYLTDDISHRVIRVNDMSGAGWFTLGSHGNGVGKFQLQNKLAIGPDGKINIARDSNPRISRVDDMTGAGWTELANRPQLAGAKPAGIDVSLDGKPFVADWGHDRVLQIDSIAGSSSTSLISIGGGCTSGAGCWPNITGISLGPRRTTGNQTRHRASE